MDGHVRVKTISLKDGGVHIRGQRSFLFFDPEEKQLRALGSVTKTENVSKRFREKVGDWAAKEGKIDDEQPCFCDPDEEPVAAAVKCPLHGERFKPITLHLYVGEWRRKAEPLRRERLIQYKKAWDASFSPDRQGAGLRAGNGVTTERPCAKKYFETVHF